MAVACALTGSLVLVLAAGGRRGRVRQGRGPRLRRAPRPPLRPAPRTCETPEESLRPVGKDGPTIEDIRDRKVKKLIVGVDQNSYRWGYRDPNKETATLEGFDIDLAHRIAEEILGDRDAVRVPRHPHQPARQGDPERPGRHGRADHDDQLRPQEGRRLLHRLLQDGPAGPRPRRPRTSPGSTTRWTARRVCSAKGSTALTELEELKKKSVIGADISTTVPNQLDCLVRLQLGEVDAVVTDSALAASQAAQDPTVELKGDAAHHRVVRRGDEEAEGRRRPGAPGQPGPGGLPRGAAGRSRTTSG